MLTPAGNCVSVLMLPPPSVMIWPNTPFCSISFFSASPPPASAAAVVVAAGAAAVVEDVLTLAVLAVAVLAVEALALATPAASFGAGRARTESTWAARTRLVDSFMAADGV